MAVNRLRIHAPGLLATVQDAGRCGWSHLGVPVGGAMDRDALVIANALVGNAAGAAAVEITLFGPVIEFARPTLVALAGAEFVGFPANRPVLVPPQTRIAIGRARRGARAVLAVAGGIAVAPVLASRSTCLAGRFGGHEGRVLRAGDELPLAPDCEALSRERFARLRGVRECAQGMRTVAWSASLPPLAPGGPLAVRALPGRHLDLFEEEAQEAFYTAQWELSAHSDRMGYRLAGPRLLLRAGTAELNSEPVCLGTVQVPPGGAPILLMADHQTTGGYARIGEVASADLPRLAQLAPGERLRFVRTGLEEARRLAAERAARLRRLTAAIAGRYGR